MKIADFNFLRVRKPQGQFITVEPQLHGIAHRRQLDQRYLNARDQTHIEKVLTQSSFSADRTDRSALSWF